MSIEELNDEQYNDLAESWELGYEQALEEMLEAAQNIAAEQESFDEYQGALAVVGYIKATMEKYSGRND